MKDRNLEASDNWATPKDFLFMLDREFQFDFDPCPLSSTPITPENDGLRIPWGKRNFINPPYSRLLKEAFIRRAIAEAKGGALCVLLLPVSTSTKIFHEEILPWATAIRFIRGRLKFSGRNTKGDFVENKCGMHDSMIVVLDGTREDFSKAKPFGLPTAASSMTPDADPAQERISL